jgi:hypothetical protein
LNRLSIFSKRVRVKGILHCPSKRLTWLKASSPGIGCTEPLRISSRRCFASVTQLLERLNRHQIPSFRTSFLLEALWSHEGEREVFG